MHVGGEAELGDNEETCYVTNPSIVPFITIIDSDGLKEEDKGRLKMMVLHSIIKSSLGKIESMGVKEQSAHPINMAPEGTEIN